MSDYNPLSTLEHQLQTAWQRYRELTWTMYTSNLDFGVEQAHKAVKSIFKSRKNFDLLCSYREKALSDDETRRVEIFYNKFSEFHLSDEINELDDRISDLQSTLSNLLNKHRCKINGSEVTSLEISNILNSCDDSSLRQQAFMARSQVNKPLVEAGFIDLINLRKEYARMRGADNYVELRLKKDELSHGLFTSWRETAMNALPDRLVAKSEFASKYLDSEIINPWDFQYLGSRICPLRNKEVDMANFFKAIESLYAKFGFSLADKNFTYDVFPRNNKSEWGYMFDIIPGKDSRILANIDNRFRNFYVLLHETGHAVHFDSIDNEDQIMATGVSGIISEGIANLFGYMVNDQIFYTDFFEDEIEQAHDQFTMLKRFSRVQTLDSIEEILFDQSLYLEDLSSLDDINQLKSKMMKELNGVEIEGEPNWGHLIHHTTHPMYLHNYIMGDVTCEMLKTSFCEANGVDDITDKPMEFGAFLQERVISPSGRYVFEDLFRQLSGREFTLDYLL